MCTKVQQLLIDDILSGSFALNLTFNIILIGHKILLI